MRKRTRVNIVGKGYLEESFDVNIKRKRRIGNGKEGSNETHRANPDKIYRSVHPHGLSRGNPTGGGERENERDPTLQEDNYSVFG